MTFDGDFEDDDDEEGQTHIVPINDTREHDISAECWCHPVPDEEDETIFVHNSADLRELCEPGRVLH
jgi:hypothetical protein